MKTIILSNATINDGNRGCVALCYCTLYLIDRVLGEGNYNIYLTDSHERLGVQQIAIEGKTIKYENIMIPHYNTLRGLAKSLVYLKSTLYALNILRKADWVMDIGQGDSFTDIYGKERFYDIDFAHKFSRHFGKSYVILPQTIGPFSNENVLTKAVKTLKNASLVMTRDKASIDYVKQICPSQKNAQEHIDVAFFLPYNKITLEKGYTHIGLNISALLWNGGYTRNNQFGLTCDYKRINKSIIDYFLQQPNTKVHLIPHVVLREKNVENDYEVCYNLWREYSSTNVVLAPFPLNPIEIKSYIAGLDFFIGARMHATIAAFSSKVPVVPLAYSRKFNGLFVNTLHYSSIADMKKNTDTEIIETIIESFNNREELLKLINKRMDDVVKKHKDTLVKALEAFLHK